MKRSRFTEEQIIGVLREQEAGMKVSELCRKHGISEPTFYAWKAKFGGLDVSEAKRLKSLEEENAKLKRLLADAMLDNVALKDLYPENRYEVKAGVNADLTRGWTIWGNVGHQWGSQQFSASTVRLGAKHTW